MADAPRDSGVLAPASTASSPRSARLRTLRLASLGYVAAGLVGSLAYLIGDSTVRDVVTTAAIIMLAVAVVVARRVHEFDRVFVLAATAVAVLYAVSVALAESGATQEPLVVSLLDLIANALIVGLVVAIVRRRRGRFSSGDFLDGAIIAVAAWIVSWVIFVDPFLEGSDESTAALLVESLYLPMSMPLVGLCALLLFASIRPGASTWLVVVGLVTNVLGDFFYALEQSRGGSEWALTVSGILYVLAYTTCGAALVHPSATELVGRSGAVRRTELRGRIVTTAIALLVPVMVVGTVVPSSSADRVVRPLSILALLLLVGWRLMTATKMAASAQDRLREMAMTDALTDLPNKTALLDQAGEVIDSAWRRDDRPALYLFDLDRFKNINDSLGHSAGDDVLRVVAARLVYAAESFGATVARPSGDEFVVLDPLVRNPAQALAHAEVLHSVFAQPITTDTGTLFVAASAGVACLPDDDPVSAETLFQRADIAMYRAKSAGRNCLALYDESMQERVSRRLQIETDLHSALERREFRVFHQPIVDIERGTVSGFEALIRWQRPDGTLTSPVEFIGVAEETGIITSIGSWALLEAMSQLVRLTEDHVVDPDTTMSVNVSPVQLADPGFVDTVREALSRSRLEPHRLWIEVTESMMIESPDVARATLKRIRHLGANIALDDFGTGYSSLSLLSQFPLQRIKIDRVFIDGIADSPNDRALVRTIVGMGHSLGLDIVAEGVETVEQLRMLSDIGCAKAQGFLISHPVPAEAMRSTVAALRDLIERPDVGDVLGLNRP